MPSKPFDAMSPRSALKKGVAAVGGGAAALVGRDRVEAQSITTAGTSNTMAGR